MAKKGVSAEMILLVSVFLLTLMVIVPILYKYFVQYYFWKELAQGVLWGKAKKGASGLIIGGYHIAKGTILYITATKVQEFAAMLEAELFSQYNPSLLCSSWYNNCKKGYNLGRTPWTKLETSMNDLKEVDELKKECMPPEVEAFKSELEKRDKGFSALSEKEKVNALRNFCGMLLVQNCKDCIS